MAVSKIEQPEHHHAFKKGYRAALTGGLLHQMPSYIRKSQSLREHFEQGWQQAKDELEAGKQLNRGSLIRHRLIWIALTAFAGLAMAVFMIQDAQHTTEPTPQAAITSPSHDSPQPNPSSRAQSQFNWDDETMRDNDFGLLSQAERQALISLQNAQDEDYPWQEEMPLDARITVKAEFIAPRYSEQSFAEVLPRYIRQIEAQLTWTPDIAGDWQLRWLWQRRLISHQTLSLPAGEKTTQTINQTLYSAWSGQWALELLDPNQQTIYRFEFYYGRIDE